MNGDQIPPVNFHVNSKTVPVPATTQASASSVGVRNDAVKCAAVAFQVSFRIPRSGLLIARQDVLLDEMVNESRVPQFREFVAEVGRNLAVGRLRRAGESWRAFLFEIGGVLVEVFSHGNPSEEIQKAQAPAS